ncbi:MAG: chaperone modulator CbpM [Candidatus Binataceae bacterium]
MARRAGTSRPRVGARRPATLVSRSVLCTVAGVSERELILWEQEELIAPAQIEETRGHRDPLYDAAALRRVRIIRTLAEEMEVNLPGIGVILHLLDQYRSNFLGQRSKSRG